MFVNIGPRFEREIGVLTPGKPVFSSYLGFDKPRLSVPKLGNVVGPVPIISERGLMNLQVVAAEPVLQSLVNQGPDAVIVRLGKL